jgi:hypothetical protein
VLVNQDDQRVGRGSQMPPKGAHNKVLALDGSGRQRTRRLRAETAAGGKAAFEA